MLFLCSTGVCLFQDVITIGLAMSKEDSLQLKCHCCFGSKLCLCDGASGCNWLTQVSNASGRNLLLDWSRGRIFDRDVAQVFLNLIKAYDSVRQVIIAV